MDRREALQLLATGAALQLAPHKLIAVLQEARAVLGAPAAPRTMNPHQFATVTTIADLIIPRTETPGAKDVGVSDFIDLILTEWCSPDEQSRFLKGLADIDARCQKLFGKNLNASSPSQQKEILKALGEEMAEDADSVRYHARGYRGSPPEPD